MGVPVIEQSTGERTSPAGRLMSDVNAHDVMTVPPAHAFMKIGSMGMETRG